MISLPSQNFSDGPPSAPPPKKMKPIGFTYPCDYVYYLRLSGLLQAAQPSQVVRTGVYRFRRICNKRFYSPCHLYPGILSSEVKNTTLFMLLPSKDSWCFSLKATVVSFKFNFFVGANIFVGNLRSIPATRPQSRGTLFSVRREARGKTLSLSFRPLHWPLHTICHNLVSHYCSTPPQCSPFSI